MPSKNRLPIIILLEEHDDHPVNQAYHLIMQHLHRAGYDTHAIEWPRRQTQEQLIRNLKYNVELAENLFQQTAEFLTIVLQKFSQTNNPKKIIQAANKFFATPSSEKNACIALLFSSMNQHAQITMDNLLGLSNKNLNAVISCFEKLWMPSPVVRNGEMLTSWQNSDASDRRDLLTRYKSTENRLKLYISLEGKMQISPIDLGYEQILPSIFEDIAQRDRVMSFALASKYLEGRNIVMVAGKNHLPGIFAELNTYNLAQNVLFFDMNSAQTITPEISKINSQPRCKFDSTANLNLSSVSQLLGTISPENLHILQTRTNLLAIEAIKAKFQGYPFVESLFIADPSDPSIAECITAAAKAHLLPVSMRRVSMSTKPLIFTQPTKPPALSFDPIKSHALLASMITASLMLSAFISLQLAKYKRNQLKYNRPKNR